MLLGISEGISGIPPGSVPGPPGDPPRDPGPPRDPENPGFSPKFPDFGPPGDPPPGGPKTRILAPRRQIWAPGPALHWGRAGRMSRDPGFPGSGVCSPCRDFGGFRGAAALLINVFFGQVLVCFLVRGGVRARVRAGVISGGEIPDSRGVGNPQNPGSALDRYFMFIL